MRRILCILLILSAILLAGCVPAEAPPTVTTQETAAPIQTTATAPETTPAATEATEAAEPALSGIDLMMEQMPLEEKVGQLFIVAPEALVSGGSNITGLSDDLKEGLEKYPVGGIIHFAGNITAPEQISAFNADLQGSSAIPLFICVDEEGGIVARLARNGAFDLPKYKSAASVGSGGDSADALEMGSTIGSYLSEYGFNLDFAPVADVNTNPNNPVIGSRAFSSDAATAARMAGAMAEGLRQQGIIPTFKHFPGHGDTAEDSHVGLAVSHKTEAEMRQCEWLPFATAGSLDCVMAGHIAVPEITGDMTPATMSYRVITEILKEDLGFSGLVVTDSLSMGAITDTYSSGEAALKALEAGCDLLLMPEDLEEAYSAVLSAVQDGSYSEDKLNETVRRILQFKQDHGLLEF